MNRESYNNIAALWDNARVSLSDKEREYLGELLSGMEIGSSLLDLGCGTGRPISEYVLSEGYNLTGVDQAENLLAIARERMPQATWIESSIEDFNSTLKFNAIICWDALFHIDRSRHEKIFAKFAQMLLPEGRLMLTCGGSEHPAFTDTMFNQTFFYDSFPPETVVLMLKNSGFEMKITEFLNLPTGGRDKGRYAIVASLLKK